MADPAAATVKLLAALSTSVSVSVPVAVGVPGVPLATPPASTTVPLEVPEITAASLLPSMVTVTICWVPSAVVTVKVSVRWPPTLSA